MATAAFTGIRLDAIYCGPERDAWHGARQVMHALRRFDIAPIIKLDGLTVDRCLDDCLCHEIARVVGPTSRPTVAHAMYYEPGATTCRTRILILLEVLVDHLPNHSQVLLVASGEGHSLLELAVPDENARLFPRLDHGEMVRMELKKDNDCGWISIQCTHIPCPVSLEARMAT